MSPESSRRMNQNVKHFEHTSVLKTQLITHPSSLFRYQKDSRIFQQKMRETIKYHNVGKLETLELLFVQLTEKWQRS